jgi:hypothetical protein
VTAGHRRTTAGPLAPALVLAAAVLAGCSGAASSPANGSSSGAGSAPAAPASTSGASAPGSASGPNSPSTTSSPSTASGTGAAGTGGGLLAHVVVVVMENHSYSDLAGSGRAPWENQLPAAVLTNWYAVTHPSQPNYLALFSGSTQGVTDDSCPQSFGAPNLGRQLLDAGLSFAAYSEDLPATGSGTCSSGGYARKHAPWTDFTNVPASTARPFTAFPSDYTQLPRLSFVIPNLCHDMHDCSVAAGDSWLKGHLDGYVTWARSHASLLVVTYDEDDSGSGNHIFTLVTGAGVRPGRYGVRGDHYTMLRTLESLFGLPGIGEAARRSPVQATWS